ncbi:hypothetical protein W97_06902 [Coniosporium apollinis CBS 100218]|uniref:NAD-dependent epimerase/dehydratase domain-containing protein n=1 Tax=Coniosporium apollinis (strain CBS 100218) TaxID=1168221 RepID=R7Z0G4_CONA1|nr:uncharacterized protein W97_06902 [Coniosporium apollinis CBS 100218]EON67534.1 hypothetical protein W97_06902 [Coniosporium apollinis CBS 100218]
MAQIQNPAIPQGSLVLVTAANGYIGSHVADQLLASGFKVRGTVRDVQKSSWLAKLLDSKYGSGKFELVAVEEMTAEGAFDEAVKGVSGVIHLASVLTFSPDPNAVIPPTIAGTLSILKSTAKEPAIKRFVYTSSATAVLLPKPNTELTVGQETFNYEAIEAAWAPPPYTAERAWAVYAASKAQAEQEVWKWARDNKEVVVNTVLPNANFGKLLSPEHQQHRSTTGVVTAMFNGDASFAAMFPPQYYVNVQDTAILHVAALLRSDVANERIYAYAAPFSFNDALAVLRKAYPQRKFPDDIPDVGKDLTKVPRERAEQLLKDTGRPGWASFEQSIKESVEDLV